jgi:NADPH:quinone reductase-like Zn-dependent oxidoreductase
MEERMNEKGIFYRRWGGPDELEYGELPDNKSVNPETLKIKPDYLLIKVKAISVNPVDWKVMSGSQRMVASSRFPRIFGSDFSGEIFKMGSSTEKSGFSPGDRVMGMVSPLTDGSGRQWLMVKAGHCIKIPENLSFSEAASLPAAGMSAILATRFASRKKNGKVLIFGAGGGVGSLALQIMSYKGWNISAVAREDQHELLKTFGCNGFLDRNGWHEDLKKEWDAIIDGPAAIIKEKPSKFLKRGGFYSPVFIPDPFIPAQIFRIILWTFSAYSTSLFLANPSKKSMGILEGLILAGALNPVIDSVWKIDQCREAVAKSKKGGITGKIIIEMN